MKTTYLNYNNSNLLKSGNKLFSNKQVLSIINNNRYFPYSVNNSATAQIIIIFNEPTTVTVDWGNGVIERFDTFINVKGQNEFSIRRNQAGTSSVPYSSLGKDYGTAKERVISFAFDRELVVALDLSTFVIPSQVLSIPISDYTNLKRLYLAYLIQSTSSSLITGGSLKSFNLSNVDDFNIEELSINGVFSNTESSNKIIPVEIFSLPLKILNIGGSYNTNDFTISNMNKIGLDLAHTLESLTMTIPFSQAQGLPSTFINLTKLKNLTITNLGSSFLWTSLPSVIQDMIWLESFSLSYGNFSGFTSMGINWSSFLNLKIISFPQTISNVTDFSWINTIPISVKSLRLQGFTNQSRLNSTITALYNKIKNNSNHNGLIIQFESIGSVISAIPTGVYQEPTTIGSPTTPKECIWELNNIYGCTITYRTI